MFKYLSAILYFMLVVGEILVFRNEFKNLYYNLQMRDRAKRKDAEDASDGENLGYEFLDDLNKMIAVTLNVNNPNAAYVFVLVSMGLGALVFAVLSALFSSKLGVLGFLMGVIAPYGILKVRLQNFRVDISREGEIMITELLNNYRINYYNMREAIEKTALTIQEAPHSKKMLLQLTRDLTNAATVEDTKDAIEKFRYSLNTSWGDILATNITFGYVDGVKITNALVDLVDSIGRARKTMEQNNRENNESGILLKYLFPISYVLTYFGAIKFFGFTTEKFVYYQFKTESGMMWFMILVCVYIGSMAITSFLTKQKMDI